MDKKMNGYRILAVAAILFIIAVKNAESRAVVVCKHTKTDLIFVVDSSGSIGTAHFEKLRGFLIALVNQMDVSARGMHIGLLSFSSRTKVEFKLNKYTSKAAIINAIKKIRYMRSGTNTHLALGQLPALFSTAQGGRRGVTRVAIVITDGKSANQRLTAAAVPGLRRAKILTYSVGITPNVRMSELKLIATDPDSTHVFTVKTFSDLKKIIAPLGKRICKIIVTRPPVMIKPPRKVLVCKRKKTDLILVVDSSGSIGTAHFEKLRGFLIAMVNQMDVSARGMHIGLLSFSSKTKVEFKLNKYTSKAAIINAIKKIRYMRSGTNTHLALRQLPALFSTAHGGRRGASRVAVVITDGKSYNQRLTAAAVPGLRRAKIVTYAVGITPYVRMSELKLIATDPDSTHVFTVKTFSDLKKITGPLGKRICRIIVIKPTRPNKRVCKKVVCQACKRGYKKNKYGCKTCECNPEPACKRKQTDLIFVVDSSGSIGTSNFEKLRKFLIAIVNQMDVSAGGMHIGMLSFSSKTKVEFKLNKYTSKAAIISAIKKARYMRQGTSTDKALRQLPGLFTTAQGGRRGVTRVAIVITDGKSASQKRTVAAVPGLRKAKIATYSVGITPNVRMSELKQIATDPDSTHVFTANTFADLKKITSALSKKICTN